MRFRSAALAAISILVSCPVAAQPVADPDPARFQAEIDAFRDWDVKNSSPDRPVLFVGSSSIRMWDTARAFAGMAVVNRGFGGAHISDVLTFFDRTVAPYAPRAIVLYCGDNDVADGKPPEQVAGDFERFVERVRSALGAVPIVYVTIKPSTARWSLRGPMQRVNEAVAGMASVDPSLTVADIWTPMVATGAPPSEALFLDDGLHLSSEGYAIWNRVVRTILEALP